MVLLSWRPDTHATFFVTVHKRFSIAECSDSASLPEKNAVWTRTLKTLRVIPRHLVLPG